MKLKELFKKFEKLISLTLGAAVLTAILLHLEFNLVEAKLYDFRVTHGLQPKPDPSIVLVTIDDNTVQELGEYAPLPLDLHTKFLKSLSQFKPKAVGYLVNMNYVNQMDPDLFLDRTGENFVEAAQDLEDSGVPFLIGTPLDVNGEVLPPYPLSSLPHSVAIIHKDGNVFSGDKITRRAVTAIYKKPTFHLQLAQKAGLVAPDFKPRGNYKISSVETEYFFFRYHGEPQKLPYPTISFADFINGKVSPDAVNGKILLVSTYQKENPSDFTKTPFSEGSEADPKMVIHANILDSILHNNTLILAPTWFNALITFAACFFVFWWVTSLTPLYGVFATLGLAASAFVGSLLLFQGSLSMGGIWVPISQTLIGIFLSYYLVVPYRLIREYRKRWNYQKQNEVLVQVEKLKTNFLSLVTHDLKTPVARVQGLTEVVLKQADERLEPQDKKNLKHIIRSTEDLNRFISSILELSKVESTQLKPNFESKDINQLIEKAVAGFAPEARAKSIQFELLLEPLFPIKIDASLLSKVLNNLIDNAIKYSPENSKIIIQSSEKSNQIELRIQDQGVGLADEEKENLFQRFFRAKNAATTSVSGSGLGLYLSKYFIEAHHGTIRVESEFGKGSTFIITLPLSVPSPQPEPIPSFRTGLNFLRAFKSSGPKKENHHV